MAKKIQGRKNTLVPVFLLKRSPLAPT